MSFNHETIRRTLFIDTEVQAALLFRIGMYGVALTSYFAITLICTQWMGQPDRGFIESLVQCYEDIAYWLPGFFVLLPIAFHDFLKMSNQFAGPIVRLRREMALLIENKSERPITFRTEDYWADLSSSYNQIRGELLRLRRQLSDMEAQGMALDEGPLPQSLIFDTDETAQPSAAPLAGLNTATMSTAATAVGSN